MGDYAALRDGGEEKTAPQAVDAERVPLLGKSRILSDYVKPRVLGRDVPSSIHRTVIFCVYLLPVLWSILSPVLSQSQPRLHFDGCDLPFLDIDLSLSECIQCNGNRTFVIGDLESTNNWTDAVAKSFLLALTVTAMLARTESIRALSRRLLSHGVLLRGGGRDGTTITYLGTAAVYVGYSAYNLISARAELPKSSYIYATSCPINPDPDSQVTLVPTFLPDNPVVASSASTSHFFLSIILEAGPILLAIWSLYQRTRHPLSSVDFVHLLKHGDRADEFGRHVRFRANLGTLSTAIAAKHPAPKPCVWRLPADLRAPAACWLGDTWGRSPDDLRAALSRLRNVKVNKLPAIAPLARTPARASVTGLRRMPAQAASGSGDP